ncbi:MAG: GTP-sensing pleiotropic transcriptional regulator CodY [Gracilibacteraceae bacterium]|jgi:transcriptional pleiotropic repressor|nr:GTP-sensing pleiotropic transcriptional regulator CodY [Gracilibacteraceae bacterium]
MITTTNVDENDLDNVLDKTRAIGKLIQRAAGNAVDFAEMAGVISSKTDSNCYILNSKGSLYGYHCVPGFTCSSIDEIIQEAEQFPESYNSELLGVSNTRANISLQGNACVFSHSDKCVYKDKISTIVPVLGGSERVGTLVLAKFGIRFTAGDLIVAEYGATIIGMEILRERVEKAEVEARKKAAVQIAVGTLSYSELEAVEHIFLELGGTEGHLVASKIADRVGITRSVIVNALRKFESAGVIESKSLGMKGTYIRVLNEHLLEELDRITKR